MSGKLILPKEPDGHFQLLSSQLSVLPPPLQEPLELLQLSLPDRGSELCHVIIMAEPHGPVGSLLTVRPDHSKCLSMLIIIGCNHTSPSRSQLLRRVESAESPFT